MRAACRRSSEFNPLTAIHNYSAITSHRHRISRDRRDRSATLSFALRWESFHQYERRGLRFAPFAAAAPCATVPRTRLDFTNVLSSNLCDCRRERMGDVFPGSAPPKPKAIKETIRREEEGFNRTLDRGLELLDKATVNALITQAMATQRSMKIRVKTRTRMRVFSTRMEGADANRIFAEKDNSALF